MAHNLVAVEVQADRVVFQCEHCTARIEFMREGFGEPSAYEIQPGLWMPALNSDSYLDPCPGGMQP
jgi:hypothetical protein